MTAPAERRWESGAWWSALAGAGTFTRVEDKFVVPAPLAPALLAELRARLAPEYPRPDVRYTLIESVYFDSPGLFFFTDHFSSGKRRFKVRLRRYAPDGVWGDEWLLEVKSKHEGVTRKARVAVGAEGAVRLMSGEPVSATAVAPLNPDLDAAALGSRLEVLGGLFAHYRLAPSCRVTYARHAFGDGTVRVTLDQDITTAPLRRLSPQAVAHVARLGAWEELHRAARSLVEAPPAILEVKHPGAPAPWLEAMLARLGLADRRFSKYCCALAAAAPALPAYDAPPSPRRIA